MADYSKMDEGLNTETRSDCAEIVPSVSTSSSSSRKIEDVQIDFDKDKDKDGGLTIFDTETNKGLEYIDDPSAKQLPRSTIGLILFYTQNILESFLFRIVIVVLVLLDLILVIIDLSLDCPIDALEIVSHIIISFFVLEVLLRIAYMQKRFFYNWIEVVDMLVVLVSFLVDMIFVFISSGKSCGTNKGEDYAKLVVIGRVFRIIRVARIVYFMVLQKRHISTATRRIVSQNKRRYQKDGFDLDLCYITERVIAMSFPSTGLMAVYRNPIREVARYFDTKHKDHYRIFNLCSERDYDESLFHHKVERIFIDDHNVPTVKDMLKFCENAREFMSADNRNVIALHCKGGKGRTGTMICVWLVDCGMFDDAQESLDYFGDRRTDLSVGSKFQGVETPSQSRYVGYFEKAKKVYKGNLPPKKELKITTIKIDSIAGVGNGDGSDLSVELRMDGLLIFECRVFDKANCECVHDKENNCITIHLLKAPVISDDIKVRFFSSNSSFPKIYDHCAFFFWFHTSFIEANKLQLTRDEIDNPHKPEGKKYFPTSFAIEVNFEEQKSNF